MRHKIHEATIFKAKHLYIASCIFFLCLIFFSCKQKTEIEETNLMNANARYISQRVLIMIAPTDLVYSTNKKIYIKGVEAVIQERSVYCESGKLFLYQHGVAEGLVSYKDSAKGDLRITERIRENSVQIDFLQNNIIDKNENSCDTICDFEVLKDLHIIISKKNYEILEREKRKPQKDRSPQRVLYYIYK